MRRSWWVLALVAAAVGAVLTSIQLLEKIAKAKDPDVVLACDVNGVLSCSEVLDAWQSRVLGVPNALVGLVIFMVFFAAAALALLGSELSRRALAVLWGLAVFFALFATWFMVQTALVIGALCIWCTGITTAVLLLVLAMTRQGVAGQAFGGAFGGALTSMVAARQDVIVVAVWWVLIALTLWFGL